MAGRSKGSGGRSVGKRSSGSGGGKYLSAKTGRYVTEKHGKISPNTTVKESK